MAFQRLKELLCSGPVLPSLDFTRPFILQTDASDRGIGAVLRRILRGKEHPIAYFSNKLLPREERYSINGGEGMPRHQVEHSNISHLPDLPTWLNMNEGGAS